MTATSELVTESLKEATTTAFEPHSRAAGLRVSVSGVARPVAVRTTHVLPSGADALSFRRSRRQSRQQDCHQHEGHRQLHFCFLLLLLSKKMNEEEGRRM